MKIEYLADELREILQDFADKYDVHIAIEHDFGENASLELNRYTRQGSLILLKEWSTVFAYDIMPERNR